AARCRRCGTCGCGEEEPPAKKRRNLANSGGLLVDWIRGAFPLDSGARAMTFPATVHPSNGQFEATLVGAPDVRATARTRDEALAALESVIAQRLDRGELVALEVRRRG